jgi:hypothetical protein
MPSVWVPFADFFGTTADTNDKAVKSYMFALDYAKLEPAK